MKNNMIKTLKTYKKIILKKIRRIKLWLSFYLDRKIFKNESHAFRCNICGTKSIAPLSAVKHRELASCFYCGSTRRLRSIIAALCQEIFNKKIALPDLNNTKHITGIGLSDADDYAIELSKFFSYQNTFYHKEPKIDITSINRDMYCTADFITVSDVFEHISPPIDLAFDNLFNILKKNGTCIFSAPYKTNGVTEEHFPDLFDYKIIEKNGKEILVNITRDGKEQIFENLVFHGGIGATLEMRLFSKPSLLKNMETAGFNNIIFHNESIPEFGILIDEDEPSLVISMRKPQ